jgi:hypothetical protein
VNWVVCVLVFAAGAPRTAVAQDANDFDPPAGINTSNVSRMKLAFSFRTGQTGGQSGAPAVSGGLLLL